MADKGLPCFCLLLLWVTGLYSCSQQSPKNALDHLRDDLEMITDGTDAEIGIALLTSSGDSVTLNNDGKYPMMSVFKFHQALAVANEMYLRQIPLNQQIRISQERRMAKTYSPMKKDFPKGDIFLSIGDLLSYTLQQSDNIACDILFDEMVSPEETQHFLQAKEEGLLFQIVHNEEEMQQNSSRCYDNWTTPFAAADLVRLFLEKEIVSEPYFSWIKQQMLDCQTGKDKLPRNVTAPGIRIGHKTGGGPTTPEGRQVANNDLGFVLFPDNTYYTFAIFVKDAKLTQEESDKVVRKISERIHEHFKKL